jgi:hypothetical protein
MYLLSVQEGKLWPDSEEINIKQTRNYAMKTQISQIQDLMHMIATARDLDLNGHHLYADVIDRKIVAAQHTLKAQVNAPPSAQSQQQPTMVYPPAANYPPTSNFMGSTWTNTANIIGAWTNQNLLHNNQRNIQMLSERIVGLRQDIAQNANQLPQELIQSLCAVLDQMAHQMAPYVQRRSAERSRTLRRIRYSGVGDVSGLKGLIDSLKNLTEQILGNVNPVLERSLLSQIGILENYLGQFEQGIASGYAANYQAQLYADNQTQSYGIAGQTKPADSLTPQPQQQQTGDWYSDNGTTPELFQARCQAWGDAHGGLSGLSPHLRENGVPQNVISDVLRNYADNGNPQAF